jgi:hypothetical protein
MTANAADEQIRAKEREREAALQAKISREATIYATIFDQVRLRLEPFTKWEIQDRGTKGVEKIPPLLSGSDLKDVATSIYINLSRGISWR